MMGSSQPAFIWLTHRFFSMWLAPSYSGLRSDRDGDCTQMGQQDKLPFRSLISYLPHSCLVRTPAWRHRGFPQPCPILMHVACEFASFAALLISLFWISHQQ